MQLDPLQFDPGRFDEVMQELERCGAEQNRKIYTRHGVRAPMFGVRYADLDRLKKRIKVDHALAEALWATGNHDARVLATKIADPNQADPAQLDAWAEALDNYVLSDALAGYIARTPHARAKMEAWTPQPQEWIGRTGWLLLAHLAGKGTDMPDEDLLPYIEIIEQEIHQRANRVRDAMNSALIAIGLRSPALQSRALEAAARIGRVEVDHGETNCKTPDAAGYIRKAAARRAA
jgi:3-methyladenine DNA glycosylase AlkD